MLLKLVGNRKTQQLKVTDRSWQYAYYKQTLFGISVHIHLIILV